MEDALQTDGQVRQRYEWQHSADDVHAHEAAEQPPGKSVITSGDADRLMMQLPRQHTCHTCQVLTV